MRVASLVGVRRFEIDEAPIAPPGPGEVQIEVRAVGICGSDVHAYAEGAIGDLTCTYPMVLGHEPAGVVIATGAGVMGWTKGDAAAAEPAHYCYHCEMCLRGRHNLCHHLRFLSTPGEPGFFRDRVNLPVANLLRLPASLSLAHGTLVEPLAVALHSLALAPPRLGESAVVIGAGPIGLLTIAALKRAGVGRLTAIEPLPHRQDLARQLGADVALTGADADLARDRDRQRRPRRRPGVRLRDQGHHGRPGAADRRRGRPGRLHRVPSELRVPLDVHLWRRKELQVHQVRRSNHEGTAALALLARETSCFAPLVTHERPLSAIDDAFALVESYRDGVGKLVVRLGQDA